MVNLSMGTQERTLESPSLKVNLLEQSFNQVAPRSGDFVESFYQQLFTMYPEIKPLFANFDMREREERLLNGLMLVINNFREPDVVGPALKKLGQRHVELNIRREHYPMVGAALLATFAAFLGSNPER